eukprot:842863_1
MVMSAPLCYTSNDNRNWLITHESRSEAFYLHNTETESLFTCNEPQGFARDFFMAYASDSDTLYLVNKEAIYNRDPDPNCNSCITLTSARVQVSSNNSVHLDWQHDDYQLPAFDGVVFEDLNDANMVFVPPINEFHFVKKHYHFKCIPKANHFVFID